eukprot:5609936-Ditylum_brightwellii.AAC.1
MWWKLLLANAKFTVNTLKSHFLTLKFGYHRVASATKYGINVTCPLDLDVTKTQLQIAQKEINAILCKSVGNEKRQIECCLEFMLWQEVPLL